MMFSFFRKWFKKEKELNQITLALYDNFSCPPKITEIKQKGGIEELVGEAASQSYNLAREKGGKIPFMVVKEIVENLIHASFRDALITIFPDGNTIIVSDHGPGIADLEKAFQPGFSTATRQLRRFIRGVGSGLPLVQEALRAQKGDIKIESNLAGGTVVTLNLPQKEVRQFIAGNPPSHDEYMETQVISPGATSPEETKKDTSVTPPLDSIQEKTSQAEMRLSLPKLSERQVKVLLLIAEEGEVGPSIAAQRLELSLSTAFRELSALEELGLVETREGGKRRLTPLGSKLVPEYVTR